MYNVLNNEKCDTKYIQKTIYDIYEALYNNYKIKMSHQEMNLIIKLKQIDDKRKNDDKEVLNIKTKEQLVECIYEKYSELSESKITDLIVNSLKKQSECDMVQNIDDVLNEIISKIREKKQNERATQIKLRR